MRFKCNTRKRGKMFSWFSPPSNRNSGINVVLFQLSGHGQFRWMPCPISFLILNVLYKGFKMIYQNSFVKAMKTNCTYFLFFSVTFQMHTTVDSISRLHSILKGKYWQNLSENDFLFYIKLGEQDFHMPSVAKGMSWLSKNFFFSIWSFKEYPGA